MTPEALYAMLLNVLNKRPPQPPVGSKAAEWALWNAYKQRALDVWGRDRGRI